MSLSKSRAITDQFLNNGKLFVPFMYIFRLFDGLYLSDKSLISHPGRHIQALPRYRDLWMAAEMDQEDQYTVS